MRKTYRILGLQQVTWNGMFMSVRHSFILSRTNWLRDHTSWASSGIGVKIKSVLKNFWSLVLNFTALRYTLLFLYSETYIAHVINCEWNRSVNFSAAYVFNQHIYSSIKKVTLLKLHTYRWFFNPHIVV